MTSHSRWGFIFLSPPLLLPHTSHFPIPYPSNIIISWVWIDQYWCLHYYGYVNTVHSWAMWYIVAFPSCSLFSLKLVILFFKLCFFLNVLMVILPTLLILQISLTSPFSLFVSFNLNWFFCSHHGYPPSPSCWGSPLPLSWVGSIVSCIP